MTYITNTKTGTTAQLLSTYNRTTDGKQMVEVKMLDGRRAYWQAKNTNLGAR